MTTIKISCDYKNELKTIKFYINSVVGDIYEYILNAYHLTCLDIEYMECDDVIIGVDINFDALIDQNCSIKIIERTDTYAGRKRIVENYIRYIQNKESAILQRQLQNEIVNENRNTLVDELNQLDDSSSTSSDSSSEQMPELEEQPQEERQTYNTQQYSDRFRRLFSNLGGARTYTSTSVYSTPLFSTTIPLSSTNAGSATNAFLREFMNVINEELSRGQEDVHIVLTQEKFNELPCYPYENDDQKNCTICLGEFSEGTEVVKLPCTHIFDKECIRKWLMEDSNKCPVCRAVVAEGVPVGL